MASKNVETMRAAHESWNKRDFAGVVRNVAENVAYTDQAQSKTLGGKDKFREWTESWAKGFPDARISKAEYIDGGDVVVARFTVEGINSGPFGGLKATGSRISMPFCEVARFDAKGNCVGGDIYYDQYTLLTQLGHVQPIMAAA